MHDEHHVTVSVKAYKHIYMMDENVVCLWRKRKSGRKQVEQQVTVANSTGRSL